MSIKLKKNKNITFSEEDFKDHNDRLGSGVGRTRLSKIPVSDLERGLFEEGNTACLFSNVRTK